MPDSTVRMIGGADTPLRGGAEGHAGPTAAVPSAGESGAMRCVHASPYAAPTAGLAALSARGRGPLDPVSIADLLRNAFVYPPYSIFRDTRLLTPGIDGGPGTTDTPRFRFPFRYRERNRGRDDPDTDWVGLYHRRLCEALAASCAGVRAPWLLQSGGKDSTTLAIAAADARPDATCITYLGGREEDELASAGAVARALGLRHEALVCDPIRAYERYLAIVAKMPLLTADFALLSYVDIATEVAANGGDGVIDGLGSDWYFGMLMSRRDRILAALSWGRRLPVRLSELPLIDRSFRLCFALSSLEMTRIERLFPGSRFSDAEVDELFGREVSQFSRARLATFQPELASAESFHEWWCMVSSIAGEGAALAKGVYTLSALSLHAAYPFCDRRLREWVHREVPQDLLMDSDAQRNKVLIRRHIATRFHGLPYVARKGCFRFDLRGLAQARFDQVHSYALQARDLLPGAAGWLERNRRRLDNKFHASKFYLLAVVLPWIAARRR